MPEIDYDEEYSLATNPVAYEVVKKMYSAFIEEVEGIVLDIKTVEEALYIEALMEQAMRHIVEQTYEKPKPKITKKNKTGGSGK